MMFCLPAKNVIKMLVQTTLFGRKKRGDNPVTQYEHFIEGKPKATVICDGQVRFSA